MAAAEAADLASTTTEESHRHPVLVKDEAGVPVTGVDQLSTGQCQHHPHIGGKRENWLSITQNHSLLNTVEGISVSEQVYTAAHCAALSRTNTIPHPKLENVVQGLASRGIVRKALEAETQIVSPVFLKEKGSGKYRLILDLSNLNKTLPKEEKFKMENLAMGLELLDEGAYMTKIDLADAFFSIRVKPSERKYLRFRVGNQLWEFCRMPNGYCRAPRKFTKLMKAFMAYIRQRGIKGIVYLDDLFLTNKDKNLLATQTEYVKRKLEELGFTINLKKSCTLPKQSMEFLGYTLNSNPLSIALPSKKKEDIAELSQNILNMKVVSLRVLAKWLGKVQAGGLAWKWEKTNLRRTQMFMIRALNINQSVSRKSAKKAFNKKRQLTTLVRQEIGWWKHNISLLPPVKLKENLPEISMETDASLTGYGATCRGECLQETWSLSERKTLKINALELLAATRALKHFTEGMTRVKVLLWIDNRTAMSYINKKGGTRSAILLHLALKFWELARKRELLVTASYINTKKNVTADWLSRMSEDKKEWSLHHQAFELVTKQLGTPQVDMMAS